MSRTRSAKLPNQRLSRSLASSETSESRRLSTRPGRLGPLCRNRDDLRDGSSRSWLDNVAALNADECREELRQLRQPPEPKRPGPKITGNRCGDRHSSESLRSWKDESVCDAVRSRKRIIQIPAIDWLYYSRRPWRMFRRCRCAAATSSAAIVAQDTCTPKCKAARYKGPLHEGSASKKYQDQPKVKMHHETKQAGKRAKNSPQKNLTATISLLLAGGPMMTLEIELTRSGDIIGEVAADHSKVCHSEIGNGGAIVI